MNLTAALFTVEFDIAALFTVEFDIAAFFAVEFDIAALFTVKFDLAATKQQISSILMVMIEVMVEGFKLGQ